MKTSEVKQFIKNAGYTVTDFAKAIGCTPSTFKTYYSSGKIPSKWLTKIEAFKTAWEANNYYSDEVSAVEDDVVDFTVIKEIYASNLPRNIKVTLLQALV